MKNYVVFVNTERRPFAEATWQKVGRTVAKNKEEAINMVYAAAWGEDNVATCYLPDEIPAGSNVPGRGRTMKAEIE